MKYIIIYNDGNSMMLNNHRPVLVLQLLSNFSTD